MPLKTNFSVLSPLSLRLLSKGILGLLRGSEVFEGAEDADADSFLKPQQARMTFPFPHLYMFFLNFFTLSEYPKK